MIDQHDSRVPVLVGDPAHAGAGDEVQEARHDVRTVGDELEGVSTEAQAACTEVQAVAEGSPAGPDEVRAGHGEK